METLFKAPAFSDPVLNRAGTHLAYIAPRGDDHTGLAVLNLETGEQKGVGTRGDRDIWNLSWLDNTHLVVDQVAEKRWADCLAVVDFTKKLKVYVIAYDSAYTFVSVPKKRPLKPLVWIREDADVNGRTTGAVYIDAAKPIKEETDSTGFMTPRAPGYSLESERVKRVEIPTQFPERIAGRFISDAQGELAYGVGTETGVARLYQYVNRDWVRSPLNLESYEVVSAGDGADEVIAVGPIANGKPRPLVRVRVSTGEVIETVFQDDRYDCVARGFIRDERTGKIVGFSYTRDSLQSVWLDNRYADIQRSVDRALPDTVNRMIEHSDDDEKWIIEASSDRAPATYHFYNRTKGSLSKIASENPEIDPAQTRPMQPLKYKARDGVALEGYLTLPAGASKAAPAPMVVLAHGGPWTRDAWRWDSEVQFLANRGYAVFQPNYRGSTGIHSRYPDADHYDFIKMHQDVSDGTRKIIQTGLVDPARVAIMGTGFGANLALLGLTEEGALYRCAVGLNGVYDWKYELKKDKEDRQTSAAYEFYRTHVGDPDKDAARYEAASPYFRADQIKSPVLLVHGVADQLYHYEQTKRLVAALERAKAEVQSLYLANERHTFERLESRLKVYRAVEAFLAKNLSVANTEK